MVVLGDAQGTVKEARNNTRNRIRYFYADINMKINCYNITIHIK
jgi:hypothetical protein